jgi:hypothetical protein
MTRIRKWLATALYAPGATGEVTGLSGVCVWCGQTLADGHEPLRCKWAYYNKHDTTPMGTWK